MYQMYRIYEKEMKIKVPCEKCFDIGFVNEKCTRCGGKGVRNKTIKIWRYRKQDIVEIKRSSKDYEYKGSLTVSRGELEYYEDYSSFFVEHDKLIHFTKEDAIKECKYRNIENLGKNICYNLIKEVDINE